MARGPEHTGSPTSPAGCLWSAGAGLLAFLASLILGLAITVVPK
jgi:hypothetical protein